MSYPEALDWYIKGLRYIDNKKWDKAISCYKKSVGIWEFKENLVNLGNCYKAIGDDQLACEMYVKANDPSTPDINMKFWKEYPIALNNLGLMSYRYGHDDIALEYFNKALKLNPASSDAMFNKSITLLRMCCSGKSDQWMLAWKLYRARFAVANPVKLQSSQGELKDWDGISTVDGLAVVCEQGVGDLFMFGRYFPYLRNFTSKIYIQTPFGGGDIMKTLGWDTVFDAGTTDASHCVPLGELARLFAHREIPPGDYGRSLLKPGGTGVGYVSRGNKRHINDHQRSYFGPYFKQRGWLPLNPAEGSTSKSWLETVDLVNSVEYVVTVDTSMAHLCGIMGKECYMLQPLMESDFRWGDDSMGTDNVWYPSVKVVRNPASWDETFARLEELIASRK